MAISAGGLSLAAVGGIVVYAAVANSSVLSVTRGFLSGSPPGIANPSSTGVGAIDTGGDSGATALTAELTTVQDSIYSKTIPGVTSIGAQIVAAAQQFKGDKYSMTKRNQPGFSDCSSFVAKCLIAAGIPNPAGWTGGNYPTTVSFAAWGKLKGVTDGTTQPGDILLIPGVHIAIVVDNATAIGQENPQVNVQQGPWAAIMWEPAGVPAYGHYRIQLG